MATTLTQITAKHSNPIEQETSAENPKILLVGNPNVGKSVIFGYLTGKYVTVSNYPGTTVEVSRGTMRYGGRNFEVIDTPGVNSLSPQSDDERVTRDMLLNSQPHLIIQVADAKNLRRTLLITSQLAEFGVPMVLVLNLMDEARSRNIEIDVAGLSELFGIPVIPTVATDGEGLETLHKMLVRAKVPNDPLAEERHRLMDGESFLPDLFSAESKKLPAQLTVEWLQTRDANLRRAVEVSLNLSDELRAALDTNLRLRMRTLAGRLEEARNAFLDDAAARYKKVLPDISDEARESKSLKIAYGFLIAGFALFLWTEAARLANQTFGLSLPTPYNAANAWMDGSVIPAVLSWLNGLHLGALGTLLFGELNTESGSFEGGFLYPTITQLLLLVAPIIVPAGYVLSRSRRFAERLGYWTREWKTGIPLLVVTLLLMYEFVGVIGAGTLVDAFENTVFNKYLTPALQALVPAGMLYDFFLGQYGLISVGLTYALAIVLPIVVTFFIAFGLLEDSGYLPRLAILSDRIFRVMGLNGKAVLPMVLGLGCDTMATMTTRILSTRKERIIATLLLALGVPCSAQLGVILGITSSISAGAVLTVFGVVVSQMFLVGYLSSKIIKGQRGDFIFEIPPVRVPILKNVWTKTRIRIKWYLKEALPLFLIGTLILFVLDRLRLPTPWGTMSGLAMIESALSPIITGILDLPRETAQVMILGFLRRDYGAAGLFDLVRAGKMNPVQIVTSLIVLTLFIPCVANFFMMIREIGTKRALLMLAFITPFAITVGGVVAWILRTLKIHF
ncbi:MAG TPA: ferrous iron transporter B [Blastocatellia bacterium]|nr:ferrous iron transporter B [Blastocatellia bacterium]HMY73192.1 ferrous iron transporter B [Blastocatellia bacterium]HMZ21126.1 ferrous iron transporter B [Blastocatellia bacterium]HNG28938.1 ferrous iron transporter B [Blastocatellia bacterium]